MAVAGTLAPAGMPVDAGGCPTPIRDGDTMTSGASAYDRPAERRATTFASIHLALGVAAAVLGGTTAVLAAIGLGRGRLPRLWLDRAILLALFVVALAIVTGPMLLATGHIPNDPLHLLYAGVALATLPIARFAFPAATPRRRAWLMLAGGLLLVGLFVRLLQTG